MHWLAANSGNQSQRAFSTKVAVLLGFWRTVANIGEHCCWRRRRDSNPRYGNTPYGGLANRWFQPLTHVSERGSGSGGYSGAIPKLQPERLSGE